MEQHKSAGSKTGRTKESGNTGGEKMEDSRIIELYWERSEQAIAETAAKYGSYCYAIALRFGFTKSKVKSMLMRTREKLKLSLSNYGITV